MKTVLLILLILMFLHGCGASNAKLVKRAAFDLECPAKNLEIMDLDGLSKGAKG